MFETRVKEIVRRYIREQLEDRTVAASPQRKQVQQQSSIDLMMDELEAAFADIDRKKSERDKRNPQFQKAIVEIDDLVKELQSLMATG